MERAFVGLDVGTGSVRGILVDARGRVAAVEEQAHDTVFPQPLWAEQDPRQWARGARRVLASLARVAREQKLEVASLGLTGQMHGAVVLDRADQPIRPAIIWMDQRSAPEAEELDALLTQRGLRRVTANPALPNFTATKLLWLGRHEPHHLERLAHLLLPKDYIRLDLTGEHATDVSDASGTLLLDVPGRRWSQQVCQVVGLAPSALPQLFESAEVTGKLRREVAEEVGLPAGLPVAGGAADQVAGALGAGAGEGNVLMLSLGTSGVLLGAVPSPPPGQDGRLHVLCHGRAHMWAWMGVTQAAGGSYKWLRDQVLSTYGYRDLDRLAEEVPPGSQGLFFLPYLMGERSPILDPRARGTFVGLTSAHGVGHLARAVLEGVAYSLRQVLEVALENGAPRHAVHATGGGAKSTLWRHILQATLGVPVRQVTSPEGPAYGAAMLAAQAVGQEDTLGWPTAQEDSPPPPEWRQRYEEGYRLYVRLYPTLRPIFAQLPTGEGPTA
jgi:xylulokinase